MDTYLLHYFNATYDDLAVTRFLSAQDAEAWMETLPEHRTAKLIQSEEDIGAVCSSLDSLTSLFNMLGPKAIAKKMENRKIGQRRILELIVDRHKNDPVPELPKAVAPEPEPEPEVEEPPAVAPKAPRKAATKTASAASVLKAKKGMPCVPERFAPMRAVSYRGKILLLMDGSRTLEQIGVKADKDKADFYTAKGAGALANHVSTTLFSIQRDTGIGFSFDDQNRVTAIPPPGASGKPRALAECVIDAKPAKEPKKKKAA